MKRLLVAILVAFVFAYAAPVSIKNAAAIDPNYNTGAPETAMDNAMSEKGEHADKHSKKGGKKHHHGKKHASKEAKADKAAGKSVEGKDAK